MNVKSQLADLQKGFVVFLPNGSTCVFFKEVDANKYACSAATVYDDPVMVYPVSRCYMLNLTTCVFGPDSDLYTLVFYPHPDLVPSKVYNAPKRNNSQEVTK